MKNLNYLNSYRQEYFGIMGDSGNGRFLIPNSSGTKMFHVLASNGFGWEHVSISLRPIVNPEESCIERCPNWLEMEEAKKLFFEDSETVMQICPKEEDYINNHPYVLHLWRRVEKEISVPEQVNPEVETRDVVTDTHAYGITIYKDLHWTKALVQIKNKQGIILDRFPKWNEMCEAKRAVFNGNQATILFMNNKPIDDYSLAWWYSHDEIVFPKSILVGLKSWNIR
jgi:hypothetical protein